MLPNRGMPFGWAAVDFAIGEEALVQRIVGRRSVFTMSICSVSIPHDARGDLGEAHQLARVEAFRPCGCPFPLTTSNPATTSPG